MRKFIVAGVLAALGVALRAIPASASFDHHFSVLSRTTSQHQNGNKYRFTDKLLIRETPRPSRSGPRCARSGIAG
jgi:hypothetical protein